MAITQEKISTLDEFWPLARAFFDGPADDPEAREKVRRRPSRARRRSRAARAALADVPEPWTPEAVEAALRGAVGAVGAQGRSRSSSRSGWRSPGTTISPGIFETVALLGRSEALARLDAALDGRPTADTPSEVGGLRPEG